MNNIYKERKEKFIDFYKENKRIPSYSEMMKLFSLKSKDSIFKIVSKFIEEGLVSKDNQGKIVPKSILVGARLLGTVAAGFPSPAEEDLGDTITLDDFLIHKKEATFLLKVSGESMINAGINPDDYVVVEKGKEAKSGDIVIAEVDTEWTMKWLRKIDGRVALVPDNPKFPIIYPENELNIGGVVVGVVRKYV
ncbi:repressor LexA [bacterium]|nr:repressor LexA [bacterium]